VKTIVIYSDGACSGNPGPGGWGTIVGLPDQTVVELGGARPGTTNNQMELQGLIAGLDFIKSLPCEEVRYYTDSSYVLNGVTKWIKGWASRGWKNAEGKEVANKSQWQQLQALLIHFPNKKIKWFYVRGHTGVQGNERCDEIAVGFSQGGYVDLFKGDSKKYSFDIFEAPMTETIPDSNFKKKDSSSSEVAYYLSLKNGVLERHKTWPECEQRVKGQPNVKFKKVKSQKEEDEVLKGWGYANKR
jgi:ribonuclease HI